ncbi:uncharacterized protein LOC121995399 [Zingiber officinale]|uniref:uncharacterized protein LOC121995399 n=1 Tax=Zingiber officinale TaxID=94328 RepID=UPI001C4A7846|nr:uncharacterized protein LOC121995399 [Zingiber officinale]
MSAAVTGVVKVSPSPGRGKVGNGGRRRHGHAFRSNSVGRSSAAAQSAMAAEVAEEAGGEPSSPKVTCIGQVRVQHKNPPREKRPAAPWRRRFRNGAALLGFFAAWKKPTWLGGIQGSKEGEKRPKWSPVDVSLFPAAESAAAEEEELDEEDEDEDEEGSVPEARRPLVLTRSASEPGRRRRRSTT